MALPADVRQEVETILDQYCKKRIPLQAGEQVRLSYGFRGSSVTLYEERPHWRATGDWSKMAIAQFRYDEDGEWTLYCADRNERWHLYFDAEPSENICDLLDEVDDDPTCIFWG